MTAELGCRTNRSTVVGDTAPGYGSMVPDHCYPIAAAAVVVVAAVAAAAAVVAAAAAAEHIADAGSTAAAVAIGSDQRKTPPPYQPRCRVILLGFADSG